MNKPERKSPSGTSKIGFKHYADCDIGYNQACEDWEEYHKQVKIEMNESYMRNISDVKKTIESLPSEEEIENIIFEIDPNMYDKFSEGIAKAISKRIRGEL